jgi:hypothetical protein
LGLLLGLSIAGSPCAHSAAPDAGEFSCRLEKADGTPAAAGPAMQEYLEDLWRAAQVYVETRDSRQLLRFADARRGFETALHSCRASAASPLSQGLGYDLREGFSRYNRDAQALIEVVDAQASRRESYRLHQAQVAQLLESIPYSIAPGRQGAQALKLDVMRAATQSLLEQAERRPSERSSHDHPAARDGAPPALAQYGRLATTPEERRWAAQAMGWWVEGNRRAAAVMEGEQGMQHTLAALAESRRALHAVLARIAQPAAAGLVTAGQLFTANQLITTGELVKTSDVTTEPPAYNRSFEQMIAVVVGLAVVTALGLIRLLNLPVQPPISDQDAVLTEADLPIPWTHGEGDAPAAGTPLAEPEVTYSVRRHM